MDVEVNLVELQKIAARSRSRGSLTRWRRQSAAILIKLDFVRRTLIRSREIFRSHAILPRDVRARVCVHPSLGIRWRRAEFGPARASPPVAASHKSSSLAHDVTRELHKRHRSVCCGKFRGVHGGSGEVRRPLSETGVRHTACLT